MTERNIAAEVLDALREVREHRTGTCTLKTVRVEPRPLPELTPDAIHGTRRASLLLRTDSATGVESDELKAPAC